VVAGDYGRKAPSISEAAETTPGVTTSGYSEPATSAASAARNFQGRASAHVVRNTMRPEAGSAEMKPEADFQQTAFSVAQVAVRWGVSSRHVYDLCAGGELGHLRIGGLIRVRLADLEAYEARRWHAPSSTPPTIASSSEEAGFTSGGGPMANGNAFRRGQIISARRKSSSPSS
jgi:excisionase family DNA binding protein